MMVWWVARWVGVILVGMVIGFVNRWPGGLMVWWVGVLVGGQVVGWFGGWPGGWGC